MRRLTWIAFGAVLLYLVFGGKFYKMIYDRKVDQLCAKDGGIFIYEKVVLPAENFDEDGSFTHEFIWSLLGNKKVEDTPYKRKHSVENIDFFPQLIPVRTAIVVKRVHYYMIRETDGKVLGEYVNYSRLGGDYLRFTEWQSAHGCGISHSNLTKSVFVKGDR